MKSTGPRTPEGKRAVRWNALKHGLLAQEVVIRVGPGKECLADFQRLLAALRDDLQPSGALEEILVETVAVCYWRLRRVLQAENGEIRNDLEDVAQSVYLPLAMDAAMSRQKGLEQPSRLQSSSFGLEFLLELLQELATEVRAKKILSKPSLKKVAVYFGGQPDGLAARCASLLAPARQSDSSAEPVAQATCAESTDKIVQLLEAEMAKLNDSLDSVRQKELLRMKSTHDSRCLPDSADRILRYETAIERQLYRALRQLERLQRRRKWPSFPLPPASPGLPVKNDFCETNPT